LEELRQIAIDVGFHPHEIRLDEERGQYSFSIPSNEFLKFIDEIGSDKPSHLSTFEEMRRMRREK